MTKPHLNREHALHLLKEMLRIRRFEEKCAEVYTQEKIRGFLHLYIGEEANAVGVMQALGPDDAVVATYREHGHALARGVSMNGVMAEMYGKQEGCSRGRGGSMHLFDCATNFHGGNAIVGGGMPMAVGLALAEKMQGSGAITVCFFGEGAAAEGEFHESLNLAALWELPVLFVCENNLYAMGTALARSESETDIQRKAACYNMAAEAVDGGYRLTGRWGYATGIQHGDWMLLSAPVTGSADQPDLRRFFVPVSECKILDTWHVSAMQATGSHDVEIDGLFVPEHHSIKVSDLRGGTAPGMQVNTGPLWHVPLLTLITL